MYTSKWSNSLFITYIAFHNKSFKSVKKLKNLPAIIFPCTLKFVNYQRIPENLSSFLLCARINRRGKRAAQGRAVQAVLLLLLLLPLARYRAHECFARLHQIVRLLPLPFARRYCLSLHLVNNHKYNNNLIL